MNVFWLTNNCNGIQEENLYMFKSKHLMKFIVGMDMISAKDKKYVSN